MELNRKVLWIKTLKDLDGDISINLRKKTNVYIGSKVLIA